MRLKNSDFLKITNIIGILIICTLIIIIPKNIEARECHSVDIRNTPRELERLRGCTVVKGFVLIVLLIDFQASDYQNFTYPELREVTEYMIFHRAMGIESLGQLFPNLVVIRGLRLFNNHAFIIFQMPDLKEVGLRSLISIQKGHVGIIDNPKLCYVDTVDWDVIAKSLGENNIDLNNNKCPKQNICENCNPQHCWSAEYCQLDEDVNLINPDLACHPQCLGGCYNSTERECHVCRGPSLDRKCVEKCPEDMLLHDDDYRCVSKEECEMLSRVTLKNLCLLECPPGYSTKNYETDVVSKTICFPCHFHCPKYCPAAEIRYLSDAKQLAGCNIIEGSLRLRINVDIDVKELEHLLGDIQEITGNLKVYDSVALKTLSFLRDLKVIHGDELDSQKYAISLTKNYNLETLWDWRTKKELTLLFGSVLVIGNNKLCMSEIEKLQNISNHNISNDVIEFDIHEHSCDPQIIQTSATVHTHDEVSIYWKVFPDMPNNFSVYYIIHYIKTPSKTVFFGGHDPCHRDAWESVAVEVTDTKRTGLFVNYNLTGLEQNSQYAYFVKAYENGRSRNAQTSMRFFQTEPDIPVPPYVHTIGKTHDSLTISWDYTEHHEDIENQLVTYYVVDVFLQPDDKDMLDNRDYCQHPLITTTTRKTTSTSPTPSTTTEPNCCTVEPLYDPQFDEAIDCKLNQKLCNAAANKYKEPSHTERFRRNVLQLHKLKEEEEEDEEEEEYRRKSNAGRRRRGVDPQSIPDAHKYKNFLFSRKFSANLTSYTITKLLHYRLYTLHFFACNEKTKCGSYAMHSNRTDRLETADDVEFDITPGPNPDKDLALLFKEPINPNGVTVTYEVNIRKHTNEGAVNSVKCITRFNHEKNRFKFNLRNLEKASYQFRVRSISLAGNGRYTEWKFQTFVPKMDDNYTRDGLIVSFVTILVITVILFIYYKHKYRTFATVHPAVENISGRSRRDPSQMESIPLVPLGSGSGNDADDTTNNENV